MSEIVRGKIIFTGSLESDDKNRIRQTQGKDTQASEHTTYTIDRQDLRRYMIRELLPKIRDHDRWIRRGQEDLKNMIIGRDF